MAERRPSWLTPTVFALGLVSLLTDLAGEMIVPLVPAFITLVLGGGAIAVGLVDGVAEAVNAGLQVYAGRLADRKGARKPLVLWGYTLSALVRPLIGLAGAAWQVVAVRALDRVGKGLRTSQRDSLLASESAEHERGRVYGFHRAMDHAGAVLGPLCALALLGLFHGDLRKVFLVAAIPGALSVAAILWLVKERSPLPSKHAEGAFRPVPPRHLWPLLGPVALFGLGASSDMFLLLKAGQSRSPLETLPLLWIGLHVVKVTSSLLGGQIADRMGPRASITLGWAVYVAIYTGFAYASEPATVAVLFLVYGLFHGLTEGPEKALVSLMARPGEKATAFGWYHLLSGGLVLPASLFFGWLWEAVSPKAAFLSGAGFALLALGALGLLKPGPSAAPAARP